MDIPLNVCEERDPKGLYKLARAGKIKGACLFVYLFIYLIIYSLVCESIFYFSTGIIKQRLSKKKNFRIYRHRWSIWGTIELWGNEWMKALAPITLRLNSSIYFGNFYWKIQSISDKDARRKWCLSLSIFHGRKSGFLLGGQRFSSWRLLI